MRKIPLLIVMLCAAVTASTQSISFPITLEWNYEPGKIAIDANHLRADFSKSGITGEIFENGNVQIAITSYSDCPQFENNNINAAHQRFLYIVNFLVSEYPSIAQPSEKNIIESNCTGGSAENSKRKLVMVINKTAEEPLVTEVVEPETNVSPSLDRINDLNVGETIVLEGLNFQPGKHIILNEAKPVLKKLLKIMQENPSLQIEIQGHVCCGDKGGDDGLDEQTNKKNLSWSRAQYVYDYLIENGIASSRLAYKGFAMSQPLVYPEKNIADQIKNRRVEAMVTGK